MLLKITEKIMRRNVFKQKKKITGLSANHTFEELRPVEQPLHVLYIVEPPVSDHQVFADRSCFQESNHMGPLPRRGPGTSTVMEDNLLHAISKLRHV